MSSQDDRKRAAARAALEFIEDDMMVGVGTGSTVNFFIDELAPIAHRLRGAVSSSEASTARLKAIGLEVFDLNNAGDVPIYVDGADEATALGMLIKGGGGALTREKIVAEAARHFVCVVDDSKLVDKLGRFPLPVEVLPMARSLVARRLAALGGQPELRTGFTTDNGNVILDVHNLDIREPMHLEAEINQIPGVVCNGLFARRGANTLIIAGESGTDVREVTTPRG